MNSTNEPLLEKNSEYIQFILDSQQNILILTDGKELKKANKSMLNFLGYENIEAFREHNECICDFFIEEKGYLQKKKNGVLWIDALIHDRESTPNRVKIKSINGAVHLFQVDVNEKRTDENLYSITLTDITEIEQYKKELKEQIYNIQEKQQILIQNSKMASMGEMIANIAHQWRQPLNSLSALHTVLLMDYKDNGVLTHDDIATFKEESAQYIHKMSTTIDDFRNFFSPIKEKEWFVVTDAICESIKFVQDSFNSGGVKLINLTKNKKTQICSYRNELMQVIMILLNNSRDAVISKEVEEPRVVVNFSQEEGGLKITVEDNGGGIPEDIIDRVFEPYFTTKFKGDGTGVGLYMSKMIVEDSIGGKLKLENYKDGVLASLTHLHPCR
ncbi:MAG: HAMP domain-containing sensor histidine kinase [Campylobacterota bacterium]|nr:HAMP domain-containing sensor histidine kinase [Campylobacterota bacterium]